MENKKNIEELVVFSGQYDDCAENSRVVIPEGITVIGESAFFGVENMKSVRLSNTVAIIEGSAFSECIGLESIAFPNSLSYIGAAAFYRCMNLSQVESVEGRLYNGREYGEDEQGALVALITSRNSETGITVGWKKA